MKRYSLTQLSDQTLRRALVGKAASERTATADLLAHIAEFDARKLYLPDGHPSMFAYCVGELRLSEDAAAKRIQAARAARRFPALFDAVAEGRLHLTGLGLLAPHLTEATAPELLVAASCKSKSEIERLLAERFPRPDALAWVAGLPSGPSPAIEEHAPAHVETRLSTITPIAAGRFGIHFTIGQPTLDKLQYALEEARGIPVPVGRMPAPTSSPSS